MYKIYFFGSLYSKFKFCKNHLKKWRTMMLYILNIQPVYLTVLDNRRRN
jgi:hypothetical protein